jgi:hypothetical protein
VSHGGNGVIHIGLLNILGRMPLREKQSIREIIQSCTRGEVCRGSRSNVSQTAALMNLAVPPPVTVLRQEL